MNLRPENVSGTEHVHHQREALWELVQVAVFSFETRIPDVFFLLLLMMSCSV